MAEHAVPGEPHCHRHWAWLLAAVSGLVPIVATHLSYLINIWVGGVEACWPYWDGCASVSRAARSGPGLMIFRGLMIVSATTLAATWLLLRDALQLTGHNLAGKLRWQTWLGVAGALFLVIYVSYLGDTGTIYRWLRRYGVYGYFGFTALAQLLLYAQLQRVPSAWQGPARWIRGLVVTLWGLGLVYAGRIAFIDNPALLDRLENAVEWVFALLMNLTLLAIAWLLWRARLTVTARIRDG